MFYFFVFLIDNGLWVVYKVDDKNFEIVFIFNISWGDERVIFILNELKK